MFCFSTFNVVSDSVKSVQLVELKTHVLSSACHTFASALISYLKHMIILRCHMMAFVAGMNGARPTCQDNMYTYCNKVKGSSCKQLYVQHSCELRCLTWHDKLSSPLLLFLVMTAYQSGNDWQVGF